MDIKRWYFKENYEDYYCLYEDERFILVQNIKSRDYSFGPTADFGSFYGFPVNQSCLNEDECIERLRQFIKIDEQYGDINKTTEIYNKMIEKIEEQRRTEIANTYQTYNRIFGEFKETEEEEEEIL